ncbi:hypothetical protein BRAO375_2100020 [Bradyrhizobium sp. ORS 375]|uniref:hypothetical protein n=1 Tax=Bradyrhizobium sp. (strain ORS 375) TaxID=566679 RepID=UPI0002407A2D|nr:hypothetical protein [Bradyrhizobium sp. ORS 375]CCD92594.1 hypothetical protein BRAO375_2100020 [Bradyrhizobium sp. ORS 375]
MGILTSYLWYLQRRGLLKPGDAVLDIGSSFLHDLTVEDAQLLVAAFGGSPISDDVAEDLAERSLLKPGREMLYLSELLEHTAIDYVSFDVCPGHKTRVFDLNREEMPADLCGSFDVVLNFGTSEHIINQVNVFKVMHDALKIGGVVAHQSPSIGSVNHGYFCYHPRFFDDLQLANGYEKVDQFYVRTSQCLPADIDFRIEKRPLDRSENDDLGTVIPCFNLNAVYRKVQSAPFRVSLELSTAHSALAAEIRAIHVEDPVVHQTRAVDLISSLIKRGAARLGVAVR